MNREQLLKKIIVQAGKKTLKYFGKKLTKNIKTHDADFATIADSESNDFLISEITKNFPDDGILSEESTNRKGKSGYLWVIDPLDGTYNFSHNIVYFGVMIALIKNNYVIAPGIYLPYFNDLYFAIKGKGSFKNNKRIYCSNKKRFISCNDRWKHNSFWKVQNAKS